MGSVLLEVIINDEKETKREAKKTTRLMTQDCFVLTNPKLTAKMYRRILQSWMTGQ